MAFLGSLIPSAAPQNPMNPPHQNRIPPQFGHHTFFKRLQSIKLHENPVLKKGQELADDLRDRYETSDNPVVHKVEVGLVSRSGSVGVG
jgi:hypothetical protein